MTVSGSASDAICRAKCIVASEGDYAQQNKTIDCISDCPKGNGTAADNLAFENFQKGCLMSATIGVSTLAAPNTDSTASSEVKTVATRTTGTSSQ